MLSSPPTSGARRAPFSAGLQVETAETTASLPARPTAAFYPVLIEVAGSMDNAIAREVTATTLLPQPLSATAAVHIHAGRRHSSRGAAVWRRRCRCLGSWAKSRNRGWGKALYCAKERLVRQHDVLSHVALLSTAASWRTAQSQCPRHCCGVDRAVRCVLYRLSAVLGGRSATMELFGVGAAADCHTRAVRRLEDFMAYHFLPLAVTHNCPPSESMPALANTFVLRHYVNEASRTSSFLLVDPFHISASNPADSLVTAVIIDPRAEQLDAYVAGLSRIGATLICAIFTHCYADGASGLNELLVCFPAARVVSGVPLAPAGTTEDVHLSPRVQLRTVRVPAFSPERLLAEIYLSEVLMGLCTGVLRGTDSAPRWDLLNWSAFPREAVHRPAPPASSNGGGGDRYMAVAYSYEALKKYASDPYAPLCGGGAERSWPSRNAVKSSHPDETMEDARGKAEEATADSKGLQRVVLFPTHGGYSNVANQLDLYWAAHLGDLARMKHSRTVIDTLATTAETFARYKKRLPPLPHPSSFDARVEWCIFANYSLCCGRSSRQHAWRSFLVICKTRWSVLLRPFSSKQRTQRPVEGVSRAT
ncbi:hypothetical protein CUR178_01421 [Leishmania enriettii]|uniref:Uncharacterized protein n=1 Tax=Leishmania enriettii TaxID=5663 RepID=A0A836GJ11_LEIEN|nr:hypothetical protein CUR178_01421 [Leishmania enriettii]